MKRVDNMFSFFRKKDVEEFSIDERKELIRDYLSKANEICYSFELNRRPYMGGGLEDLNKVISDLSQIRDRIVELENKDLIDQKNNWRKILEDKNNKNT